MEMSIEEVRKEIEGKGLFLRKLLSEMEKVIVGQKRMLDRLLIALISDGHILVEGVPGLAKTLSVKSLAGAINTSFKRIQFTPDLLPADLLGTEIYSAAKGEFLVKKGPIFTNILLADEINRAPAKVQSALLEAMQEKQVTLGDKTFLLDEPFMVMATQNPIEQEGTYPLPEAQVDRFMMKVVIGYPDRAEEKEITRRVLSGLHEISAVVDVHDILAVRELLPQIYVDEKVEDYVIDIIFSTREPEKYGLKISHLIQYGASPRASIYLLKAARALSFIQGRAYVTPQEVKEMVKDVLRHRIIPSYEAEAENVTTDDIIDQILSKLAVP